MFYWGELKLKVDTGSYNPPHATREKTVIDVIPGADIALPASILQEGGRARKVANLSGFCTSYTEYDVLYQDYLNSIIRTFTGPSGETLEGIIYELSPATRVMARKFEYDIVFMEV
jgi:exoribonuclease II